jgi:tRNA(Ile)-lysidine synthase
MYIFAANLNVMSLLNKIQKYIDEKRLLEPHENVIIGLSGGADSIAMLHILRSLGYRCIAAHCNFRLRGEESDRDEAFVRNFCNENAIELHTRSFDTYSHMREKGISLEMAARELRYRWFEKLNQTLDIHKIAVAHHQDDSVETILINLTRGSGIKGLTGIPPQNKKIVRPLLCVNREEIREYLKKNNLPFVDDSSNAEDIYLRNKIRLNILPELEKMNPSVRHTISQTSVYLKTVEIIYRKQIDCIISKVFGHNTIDIPALLATEYPETVLFELLHPYGFNAAVVKNILEAATGIPGKIFYSNNYRLVKDRNVFILKEKSAGNASCFYIAENTTTVTEPVSLSISHIKNNNNFEIERSNNVLSADKALLTFPLCIRKGSKATALSLLG